jgi:phosphonate transport system ATP-binding protein
VLQIVEAGVVYSNGVCALDGVSLTFRTGGLAVLLGPSGSGKSTLLRCLNGLVRASRGDVCSRDGGSIFADRAALRRHRRATAMIFQQHHLIGRLTALQNVLIGRLAFHRSWESLLPPSRTERRLALAALDRVGLIDHALSRADELSGGQQQRVGIARALVQAPHTILADEPVASLDPATALRILELIHRICREDGITTIMSLHQLELARRFADRVIGLAGGRVVFDGSTADLAADAVQRMYGADPAHLPASADDALEPSTRDHRHDAPIASLPRRRSNARHGRHARFGG